MRMEHKFNIHLLFGGTFAVHFPAFYSSDPRMKFVNGSSRQAFDALHFNSPTLVYRLANCAIIQVLATELEEIG